MDKNLLKRALEDTEDPTPGYMFRDIAQWTFIDQSTQSKLIAYLMDKLKPSASVHVLAKTLKVLKVLCETGHTDFQKEMQRLSDELKQYASYRGKPDAKYGDKLNEKVRTTAREAIDAAFTHRKETKIQAITGHGSDTTFEEKKSIFSTGNSVTPATTTTTSSGSSDFSGGGGRIAPMPTTNKWAEHMAQAAAGKPQSTGWVATAVDAAKSKMGWSEGVKSTQDRVLESMSMGSEFRPAELGFGGGHSTGGFGGGAGASGGSWKFTDESAGPSLMPKEETKILTPYQMEVEKICSFKNTPQRVDLTQFVTAVEGIAAQRGGDVDELAQDLDERLQQKFPWQQRLNALSAVEAILRHNALPGHESFAEYFKENPEDVQRNVHVVQGSLKEKAQKVLKLLGVPERTSAQQESSAAPAQQLSVATGNGGISWASSAPVANQEAPPAAPAGDGADLLGGMTVKSRHNKSTEDKTKLRKRAAMTIADDEEPAPVAIAPPSSQPPQQKATDSSNNGWGNTWGDSANTTTQSNGAWGTFDSTPVVAQQQQQQPAAAAAPKPKNDLDDFFSAPSSWAPPPIPQQSSGFATTPAPAPVAAAPVAQQQPLVNNATTQMVLQMQQQMQTMLSQINMADPNAMAQMQALMAQQQQLMALVAATSQQQQVVASQGDVSQNTPVVPHGHFSVPVQGRQVPVDDSFAAVQREMMSKMMGK